MIRSSSSDEVLTSADVSRLFAFRPNPSDQRRLLQMLDALKRRYGIPEPSRLDAVRLALRIAATQLAKADVRSTPANDVSIGGTKARRIPATVEP